jgi:hypothetical protein
MTREEIEIGKTVWYYPILGDESSKEEAVVTSEPFNWYDGTVCCNIDTRSCIIDIENLEPRENVIKIPLTKDELIAKLEEKQKELSAAWFEEHKKEEGEWKTYSKADELRAKSIAYKECIAFIKANLV